ncbi:MAG: class I SAM-dependent methyltransferase [bacterium]
MNIDQKTILAAIARHAPFLVWWKPEQLARGEHIENNPTKGERPWIIPETTGAFLYSLVQKQGFSHILELGTSIGYSTLWLAYAIEPVNGSIHTIERSINKVAVARDHFNQSNTTTSITLHEGFISDVINEFPDALMFDFVFMDADRGHYHEYFHAIKKHLLPGALIIADNAGNMHKRMQPFFDLLTQEGWTWTIHPMDNGLLIASGPEVRHNN